MSNIIIENKVPKAAKFPSNLIEIAKNPSDFINKRMFESEHVVDLNIFFKFKSYLLCTPNEIEHVFVKNNRNYIKGRLFDPLRISIGNGLVTSDGDFWKKQRRLVQPAFHKQILVSFTEEIDKIVDKLIVDWKIQIENGKKEFNVSDEMMKLTLDMALKLLFGSDISGKEDRFLFLLGDINKRTMKKMKNPYHLPFSVPTSGNIRFKKHLTELHDIIQTIITKRRQDVGNKSSDLLQLLLDATCEDSGEGMSEEQLMDEVVTLFVAGSETSGHSLAWTLYLLSENREKLTTAENEVQKVSTENQSGLEALRNLRYLGQAVSESLRIYPPIWMITREAIEDDEISGFKIEKGSQIYIPVRGIQNNPKYWDEPEQFIPERWNTPLESKYSYIPFGAGPRLCVGAELAKMEITLSLFKLIKEFKFETTREVIVEPSVTLRPKDGLYMNVTTIIKK